MSVEPLPVDPGISVKNIDRRVRRNALIETLEQQRLERAEQRAEQRRVRADLERKCLLARNELRRLTDARYVFELDADGNRVVYDDERRARSEQSARRDVEEYCR